MKPEDIDRLWQSPANRITQKAEDIMLDKVLKNIRRSRRGFHIFTGYVAAVLGGISFVAGYTAVKRESFDWGQEWGVFALLGLCWCVLILIRVQHRRHERAFPYGHMNLSDALAAMQAANALTRLRLKVMGVGLLVAVPLMGAGLWQLQAVGKMSAQNVMQFAMLAGGALSLSVLVNLVRYFRVHMPEAKRLQQLRSE
ncbi:MAG: hypothetical protein AAGC58_10370 [Asticcacaulis sp.]